MMLDLISYTNDLEITQEDGKTFVYDVIRKKKLVLQPEELVRQCILHFLLKEVKVPHKHIKIEAGIKVNNLYRRCDIIVYNRNINPILLIECKTPGQKLNQKVFNQIAMYNLPLRVPYLMVSNGKQNYFCKIDFENETYTFLESLPDLKILSGLE